MTGSRYPARKYVVEALHATSERSAPETWDWVSDFEGPTAKADAHTFAKARTASQKTKHRVTLIDIRSVYSPKRT